MIAIWLILFLLGCTLAVIVAIGAAVVHGRFVLAAVVGGGAFFFVIAAAVFFGFFAIAGSHNSVAVEPSEFKFTGESMPPQVDVSRFPQITVSRNDARRSWRIDLVPAILLVCAGAFLAARFAKNHFAHAAADHARSWPIMLVIVVLGMLMYRGVRYQPGNNQLKIEENNRVEAEQSAEINAKMRAEARALSKQQQELAKRVAELTKNIQQRIDNSDIHQLMDEFDAPRIVLQTPFASMSSPAALVVATAPGAFQSFEKSKTAEDSSTATQTTEHSSSKSRRKSGVKPASYASTKKKEQPPAQPEAPAPPSPPAPSAAPPLAEIPAVAVTEAPQAEAFELHKPEEVSTASAWRLSSAKKPEWTKNPLKRTGDVRREVIATEEYATASDCYRAEDICLMLKAYDRLQEKEGKPQPYTASDYDFPPISFSGKKILFDGDEVWNGTNWTDGRFQLLSDMGIDPDFLRREIIAKDPKNNESCEYIETAERESVGPMKRLYVQIEFTSSVDRELMQRHDAFERRHRFAGVGLGAFSIFGLLSIAWGLLKADTATKGYYTKWLFIGVPIAIIGVTMLSLLALVGIFRG